MLRCFFIVSRNYGEADKKTILMSSEGFKKMKDKQKSFRSLNRKDPHFILMYTV